MSIRDALSQLCDLVVERASRRIQALAFDADAVRIPTHGIAVDGAWVWIVITNAHVVVRCVAAREHRVRIHAPGAEVLVATVASERKAVLKVDKDNAAARRLQLLCRCHNIGYLCLQLIEHCIDGQLSWSALLPCCLDLRLGKVRDETIQADRIFLGPRSCHRLPSNSVPTYTGKDVLLQAGV